MRGIKKQRETFCYRFAEIDEKKKNLFDLNSPFDNKQDLNAQPTDWNPEKFNNAGPTDGPRVDKMVVTQGMGRPGHSGGGGGGGGGGNGGYSKSDFDPSQYKSAEQYAQAMNGKPYDYGGNGTAGRSVDCSGFMSNLYSIYTGKPTRFTTDSNFSALGFQPGYQPGAFNIGTNGGSGENGHMAGTLPDGTHVESNGSAGVQYGGNAIGATDFSHVYHLPSSAAPTPVIPQ